jgi:hypothetical protein
MPDGSKACEESGHRSVFWDLVADDPRPPEDSLLFARNDNQVIGD